MVERLMPVISESSLSFMTGFLTRAQKVFLSFSVSCLPKPFMFINRSYLYIIVSTICQKNILQFSKYLFLYIKSR